MRQSKEDRFSHLNSYRISGMHILSSFGVSFLPCLQAEFEEVTYCHRDSQNMGLLEQKKPDLVILEYVERYTGEMDEFVWDNVRFVSIG